MEASTDRRLVASRYVLGGPLGRGGMGTVWRAEDVLLGRAVAVKEVELPAGTGAGAGALRERALREARAAARLNHPGVVTLHDVVEAHGRLFLVMELVRAPTLRELVEGSGPLPPAAAARAGLELVDALEAAHAAGIVHHDVKPANVMVAPDGRVKLADFGIASLQEDTQRTRTVPAGPTVPQPPGASGTGGGAVGREPTAVFGREPTAVFGSLPYVAPEQAAGGPAGPAADLWALGATLWFAVEGVAPFERGHPAATLAAILSDPPGHPPHAGPLAPVLLALLHKDPSHRPPTRAVRPMLAGVAAALPVPTRPAPTPPLGSVPTVPSGSVPTVPWGGARGSREPEAWLPGPPIREGSPAGPEGRGAVHSPRWSAPPRRRRRGRWLPGVAVLLLLLLLLLVVANGLGDRRSQDPGPPGLGDRVRDGQFEFVVRSVDCGTRSVGVGFGHRTALGQFCLVRVRVEHTGNEGRTFGGGQQYLFDRAGTGTTPTWRRPRATAAGGSGPPI
jgi:serine/threonine protein kinase